MLGPVALARQRDDAEHDEQSADDESHLDRLAEKGEGDRDRDERRGPDDDGRARRPDLLHGQDVEHVRAAGGDEPGEEKRPQVTAVGDGVEREHEGHSQRDEPRDERARLRVGAPLERDAERRRHRPEEDGGNKREQHRGHGARL